MLYSYLKLKIILKEGDYMNLNRQKLEIALAQVCKNPYDLCKEIGIQYQTYRRVAKGENCKPATVGKIAKALNCDVKELLED